MPVYKPLPCLECKNIKSIWSTLKIDTIDEVVKMVNQNKHGKITP
jgi:hypothetical protein